MTGNPSVDKPWLKYYSKEVISVLSPECEVYENIYKSIEGYPNDITLETLGDRIT